MIELTAEQKSNLIDYHELEDIPSIKRVDEYDMGMDNHGAMINVCVFTDDNEPGKYFAFLWRSSSEEWFFDDKESYEVEPEIVSIVKYNFKGNKPNV